MRSVGHSISAYPRHPNTGASSAPQFGLFWRRSPKSTPDKPETTQPEPSPPTKPKRSWYQRIKRALYFATLVVGLTPGEPVRDPVLVQTASSSETNIRFVQAPGDAKPRVYVVHSGVGDPINWGGRDLRNTLLEEGIPDSNIVVLDNPYPSLWELNDLSLSKAGELFVSGWKRNLQGIFTGKAFEKPLLIKVLETGSTFARSATPHSQLVDDRYQELNKIIQARSGGQPVEVIWVGYSAGGQMGLSMAAKNAQEVEKAPDGQPIPIDLTTVITLGTPVFRNPAPPKTRLIVVRSSGDNFIDGVTYYSSFFGQGLLKKVPDNLDANDRVITVEQLSHLDLPFFHHPLTIALDQMNADRLQTQIVRKTVPVPRTPQGAPPNQD